ncbi:organic cation transporter protein-like [Prorops nasuta]|uniref:organic cation transporter protein-like n=1 Tax=Prorops nasuta TaxID=863751 RepID=UPI0034CF08C1
MNAEEVKVGCFQVILVFFLAINYIIVAMSHALPIFYNYTPNFYCHQVANWTNESAKGCQEVMERYSTIDNSTLVVPRTEENLPCKSNYRFDILSGESSVVTEWNLICDRRYLSFLGPCIYYIGVLIGACVGGSLIDRIGRLPVQAICLYTQGTMAVALYVVQDYPAFLALRGLQGVFVQGLQNSTYILSLELLPLKARTLVALLMQVSWAVGLVLLAGLSYVIPDWRILQLAISVPTAATVLYIWVIPESPRWLLAKGKSTEADMALERIAMYNACCMRTVKEDPENAHCTNNEIAAPRNGQGKSRVTTDDLAKVKKDEKTLAEATNLLAATEIEPEKVRKTSFKSIAENLERGMTNVELQKTNVETPEPNLPSSSKDEGNTEFCMEPLGVVGTMDVKNFDEEASEERKEAPKVIKNNEMGKKVKRRVENRSQKNGESVKELMQRPLLRRYGFIMLYQWLILSSVDHLVASVTPKFKINRHVTFALGGALEMVTYIFAFLILSKFGRRLPLGINHMLNGLGCIVIACSIFLVNRAGWIGIAQTIAVVFARLTIASGTSMIYLYTVEIFPTTSRGTCLGFCIVAAKIASLASPFLQQLEKYAEIHVSLTVLGVMCLVAGFMTILLPETFDKVLPDTCVDVELLNCTRENEKSYFSEQNEEGEEIAKQQVLREKLFSEEWVDAGNGILVNFSESKTQE